MAEKEIVQNMISQLGQSQGDRMADALRPEFVDVDQRTTDDFLRFAKQFAPLVNYFRNSTTATTQTWANFFSYPAGLKALNTARQLADGRITPHLSLFVAFLELYRQPQDLLNRFTARHLDFYYKEVLRLTTKPAIPDKAHVLVELKKQSRPIVVSPADIFSAGKDRKGRELSYTPTSETVINLATVESLRSIYLGENRRTVKWAPIANSLDGVGSPLPADDPKWFGFGHDDLPAAEVGFAVSSTILRMKEGERTITLTLALRGASKGVTLNTDSLGNAFKAFITAEKNWAAATFTVSLNSGILQFVVSVPATEKAIVDYSPEIHGYHYTAAAPVLQFLLNFDGSEVDYNAFRNISVRTARVEVSVEKVTDLQLESDVGTLDAKKSFLPFGPEPAVGAIFSIGCEEALSKKISKLELTIQWKNAPESFASYYHDYGKILNNGSFMAAISFVDATSKGFGPERVSLFDPGDASKPHTIKIKPGSPGKTSSSDPADSVVALYLAGGQWRENAQRLVTAQPILGSHLRTSSKPRPGSIQLQLQSDFYAATYRRRYVRNVIRYSKQGGRLVILNEPYRPEIQSIALSYEADTGEVDIGSTKPMEFSRPDLQFFHISYFGQLREHSYLRSQTKFLSDQRVLLLPAYDNAGELLVGLRNLEPGGSVSVLFQVAEGSATPLIQEKITWSVLSNNYWKPLGTEGVTRDTTNQLLTSGVIRFVIPIEATLENTILPAGLIWLRGTVPNDVRSVSQLVDVIANTVEVRFQDHDNDTSHLFSALRSGSITKLQNPLAAVKKVKQPYASFGGAPAESATDFYRRVSERLRHKDRCISAWDYQRIVLEAFPRVHKVKCIPHARDGNWFAPGHVLLIVIPDLRNKHALDRLQPKVDANTINQIKDLVAAHIGIGVQVHVKNPSYQKIRLDFKVKFHAGYEFNHYSEDLNRQIIKFLSPWAFEKASDISFGGKIYKSVVLNFIEELESVDYVTDFKMYSYIDINAGDTLVDVSETRPATPDAILVSETSHVIAEVG